MCGCYVKIFSALTIACLLPWFAAQSRAEESKTQPVQNVEQPKNTATEKSVRVSGDIYTRARSRFNPKESKFDVDLYQYLSCQGEIDEHVAFSFYGGLVWDVGGDQNKNNATTDYFRQLYDDYGHRLQGDVYEAYVDFKQIAEGRDDIEVRLGRQEIYRARSVQLDGVRAQIDLFPKLKGIGYAGIPAYSFKSSYWGNWAAGVGLEWTPFKPTRVFLDYLHITEDSDNENIHDDLFTVRCWQNMWTQDHQAYGELSLLDGDLCDLALRANSYWREYELRVELSYRQQFKEVKQVSQNMAMLTSSLISIMPYHQVMIKVCKTLGEHVEIESGYCYKGITSSDDENAYNYGYHKAYVSGTLTDWPLRDLGTTLCFEYWGGKEDDFTIVDFAVSYQLSEEIEVSAGSDFSLYRISQFSATEEKNVREFFVKCKYTLKKQLQAFISYGYERAERLDFHTVDIGVKLFF